MARRGENIYKRRDGRWEARYIKARTPDGKAVYGYLYRHSYQEVKKAQMQARTSSTVITQQDKADREITLTKYLYLWMQSIRGSVKKSTFSNYSGLIKRHILPGLGNKVISQLSDEMVQKYINSLLTASAKGQTAGLSVKTIRDTVSLLKRSLRPTGIVLKIHLPHYRLPTPRVLSRAEQTALVRAADIAGTLEGLGVLLSLFTGIRIGELCALQWKDISLTKGILQVNKTLQRIENYEGGSGKTCIEIGTPKSQNAVRSIPLSQSIVEKLRACRRSAGEEDYVLSGCQHYVEPRKCQYHFKKIVKAAGIPDINFHVLRHTFATRCVELGIDVKTISKLLGHANIQMTLDRYVHPTWEHQAICMEKLAASF